MVGLRRILEVSRAVTLDCLCPRLCVRCRKEGALICESCWENWTVTAPPNGCPGCELDKAGKICTACVGTWGLAGLASMDSYADPVLRRLIGAWKFTGDRQAFGLLKTHLCLFAERLRPYHYQAVTWVPLHASRKRGRGFDQAELLARAVGSVLNIRCEPFVERVVHTPPRAKTHAGERGKDDMAGVFVGRGTSPERVLLVDDVFTSGGTMDAAAKALKEAGAKEVWGLTLARG